MKIIYRVNKELILENDTLKEDIQNLRHTMEMQSSQFDVMRTQPRLEEDGNVGGEENRSPKGEMWPNDREMSVQELLSDNERLVKQCDDWQDVPDNVQADRRIFHVDDDNNDADDTIGNEHTDIRNDEELGRARIPSSAAANDDFTVHGAFSGRADIGSPTTANSPSPHPSADEPGYQSHADLLRELATANKARVEVARELIKAHKEYAEQHT